MALPLLADLFNIPTQQQVIDGDMIPELQSQGVRVTDWVVGSVVRAASYAFSKAKVDVLTEIAAMAAAGFEDYVFGFSQAPGGIDVTGWAPLVAKQRYNVDQILATYTRRQILLTNTVASSYGPLNPGALMVQFPSGNRYVLDQIVTIPSSSSVTATFRSEFTYTTNASYNGDPDSAAIILVTATFPGVTATNPRPNFSPYTHVGVGTGTLSQSGTDGLAHSFRVRIDSNGQSGAASWSYSMDGAAFASAGTAASFGIGGGTTTTLVNGTVNPSFVAGDIYYFFSPGSSLLSAGRPDETPGQLGTRCRGLWPMLGWPKDVNGNTIAMSPAASAYIALAQSSSNQVTQVLVQTSTTVNDEVDIVVAGQGAILDAGTVAAIQAFFNSFSMLTDRPVVSSPTARPINLASGVITVKQAQLAQAQAQLQTQLQAYFTGNDSQGLAINGRIDHAYLVELVRALPGVTKFNDTAFQIGHNGGSFAVADLQLPVTALALELPTWGEQVASVFTWSAV
jgi:hypothetical protein